MALISCDFFSETLALSTSMTVLLPQRTSSQIGLAGAAREGAPPVLYLLHGLSDDHTIWLRRTSIERYVAPLGLAVVMPQVHRSFYTDEAHGNRYWTFLTRELPSVVHRFFRLSDRPADTFVAGLSMGGYGALKWALTEPGRFAAAAGLSATADVGQLVHPDRLPALMHQIFGDEPLSGSAHDLFSLVERAAPATVPPLYLCCGTADRGLPANRRLVDAMRRRGLAVTDDFGPGAHDWAYWDARIRDVLAWLPLTAPASAEPTSPPARS